MYIFSSVTETQSATKDFMQYNSKNDTWKILDNVPESLAKRNHGSGTLEGELFYVFAGHSEISNVENDLNDLWVYDFSLQTWTQKSSNKYRRLAQTSTFYNGKMYSFGGDSNKEGNAPISIYNPITDSWQEKNAPWGYIHKATAVTYNNSIFVFGGNNPLNTNLLRKYDSYKNTYILKADGFEAINAHYLIIQNDKIRVFGGNNFDTLEDTNGLSNNHLEYDLSKDFWIKLR